MNRVAPSEIVYAIEATYPWAKLAADGDRSKDQSLGPEHSDAVAMILELLERLPEDLYPTLARDIAVVHAARGALRGALINWTGAPHAGSAARLQPRLHFDGLTPIPGVLQVLRKCPDERRVAAGRQLAFIRDRALRESLASDLASARRTIATGDFKAATVLAGSVVEGVLLACILKVPASTRTAALASASTALHRPLKWSERLRWTLEDLLAIASAAAVVKKSTLSAADSVRDYRNLIHPGKELRTKLTATSGSAHLAVGVAELLIEELG